MNAPAVNFAPHRLALAHHILTYYSPDSGCSFCDYVYWVLEPAAQLYVDEGMGSEVVNTPYGDFTMNDVVRSAKWVAEDLEKNAITSLEQLERLIH